MCCAQPSLDRRVKPWAELGLGWNTPAGGIGALVGAEVRPWLIPTVACGSGAEEGVDLSAGIESRMVIARPGVEFRQWAYWTAGLGGRNTIAADHYYDMGTSQQVKVGLSYPVFKGGRMSVLFGIGYAWFIQRPSITATVPPGMADRTTELAADLCNGPIARLGIRLHFGQH